MWFSDFEPFALERIRDEVHTAIQIKDGSVEGDVVQVGVVNMAVMSQAQVAVTIMVFLLDASLRALAVERFAMGHIGDA